MLLGNVAMLFVHGDMEGVDGAEGNRQEGEGTDDGGIRPKYNRIW